MMTVTMIDIITAVSLESFPATEPPSPPPLPPVS